jgi:hypothetical protein
VLDLWAHNDDLRVLIHWNDDGQDIQLKSILEAQCSLNTFAWAVWGEAARQLRELGAQGYVARSAGFRFPAEDLGALHRTLVAVEPRAPETTGIRERMRLAAK